MTAMVLLSMLLAAGVLLLVRALRPSQPSLGEQLARLGAQTSYDERYRAAAAHGLRVRLHAEQLSNQKGAALAAQYRALSADHLEYTGEEGARAMAGAGTVATLLPGAFYMLGETRKPPVELFRRHGVRIALGTDWTFTGSIP